MMEYLKMVWEGGWPFWLVNGALAWIVLGSFKAVFLDLPRYILSPTSHLINGFRPLQMEELAIVDARKGFVLRPFCLVACCSIGAECKIFIFMR